MIVPQQDNFPYLFDGGMFSPSLVGHIAEIIEESIHKIQVRRIERHNGLNGSFSKDIVSSNLNAKE